MRVNWERFRDEFGRDEIMLITVRPKNVFDLAFLSRLRDLHRDLERSVPHLDEVTSLVNARYTHSIGDDLIVEELLEDWPTDDADLARIERAVATTPYYENVLISTDRETTAVIVRLSAYGDDSGDAIAAFDDAVAADEGRYLSGEEATAGVRATLEVVARHQSPEFELRAAGTPFMTNQLLESMMRDMSIFLVLMMAVVCGVLFALFRRLAAVVLPVAVVLLSIAATIGVMAATGIPLNLPTQILPSFLLAVGVGSTVHLLTIFYQRIDQGVPRERAVCDALGHAGLPILMASLTTAGGLASFSVAELAPIAHLGWFAPVGIVMGLLYGMILLPALLATLPAAPHPQRAPTRAGGWLDRTLVRGGDWSVAHPWTAVGLAAAIMLLGLAGSTQLRFSHDFLDWLPADDVLRHDTRSIDREMGGTMVLEAVVDAGKPHGLKDPELLDRMDELSVAALGLTDGRGLVVGKTLSVVDIVKDVNRALHENRQEYYAVPDDAALIAQELFIFESQSDDLREVVDTDYARGRFTLRVPYVDPLRYVAFISTAEDRLLARPLPCFDLAFRGAAAKG